MDYITILDHRIGQGYPTYIIAELSANHRHDFEQAVTILKAAKAAGADAVKLQTYTPDTLTLKSDNECFKVTSPPWEGRTLHDLYLEACTPWDWQPRLKEIADELGLQLFSTAYDDAAVDFLQGMGVPAFKIASFEVVDLPLLRKAALTGKPIIVSTGMATLAEIDEAVRTIREAGGSQVALLKCTSAYPAPPEEMNLRTIPHLADGFELPVGLSDHSLDLAVPVAAVALGACIIEKHLTMSRAAGGPDSVFSLEPHEFRAMVQAVRSTEKALGAVHYGVSAGEATSRAYRRSLFVIEDIRAEEVFTLRNVRSIRPACGLHTRYLGDIIGRQATRDIQRGTPLSWDLIGNSRRMSQE